MSNGHDDDCCNKNSLPPAQGWAWKRTKEAYIKRIKK